VLAVNNARTRPAVVVTTTISRTVDGFYGPIIAEFQSRGYEVHVVTSDGPEVPRLRRRADTVHIIPMKRTISPMVDLRALWAWVRILRLIRPVLVFGGTPKAALLSMVASRFSRVPRRAYFLQGLRLEGVTGTQRRLLGSMEWLTSWCSNVVVAVSPSLAARYQELHLAAGRPVKIPFHGSSHGVDSDYFRPIPRGTSLICDLGMNPQVPIVLFIGRLTADKGPDALIGALDLLRAEGIDLQLLVLGAQDEGDSLQYRKRLKASPTPVRLIDHLLDVRPYIGAADLIVLPTRREGMPNAVLEAAAMGVPCVTTTATGAVDSVVDGETGILVPSDDPWNLATAMRRLLKDPELQRRMGTDARERVVKFFQPRDVAKAIADIALCKSTVLPAGPTDSERSTRD
jgi:glycosyltransferase involved in cell wall biosynthesis